MTFLFDHERRFFAEHGPAEAFVFQSQFQRRELEPALFPFGHVPANGHLIHGAFDVDEFEFQPRKHGKGRAVRVRPRRPP